MLAHGFNPEDRLLSTIIFIPKGNHGSMNSSDNSRGFLFPTVFVNCMIMYLLI